MTTAVLPGPSSTRSLTLTLGTELAPVWAFLQLQLSVENSQASEAACLLPLPSSVYLHHAEQFGQVHIANIGCMLCINVRLSSTHPPNTRTWPPGNVALAWPERGRLGRLLASRATSCREHACHSRL